MPSIIKIKIRNAESTLLTILKVGYYEKNIIFYYLE